MTYHEPTDAELFERYVEVGLERAEEFVNANAALRDAIVNMQSDPLYIHTGIRQTESWGNGGWVETIQQLQKGG